ncbi:hypothetical protein [Salinigranum salinum]|uniref:hypothetical protein n=1 Tax=Salinigranum salinum TaxID=1364937 RepID=UPI0012607C16|nr:hypothetical protein [Salinigranum salinum]
MDSDGPVRGEHDADVAVEAIEDDEHVEYLPDERAVRYVAGWIAADDSSGRVPRFSTTPFERWAETRCLHGAARAAATHAAAELDVDDETVSGGVTADVDGIDRAAVVTVRTILDREGRVVSAPAVAFDALVAATPRTVEIRYRLADQMSERDVPVYARSIVERLE